MIPAVLVIGSKQGCRRSEACPSAREEVWSSQVPAKVEKVIREQLSASTAGGDAAPRQKSHGEVVKLEMVGDVAAR